MMDLTGELFFHACSCKAVETAWRKEWLIAEQRLLKREHMIAHVVATDGEVFSFFRMDKEGQICNYTQTIADQIT